MGDRIRGRKARAWGRAAAQRGRPAPKPQPSATNAATAHAARFGDGRNAAGGSSPAGPLRGPLASRRACRSAPPVRAEPVPLSASAALAAPLRVPVASRRPARSAPCALRGFGLALSAKAAAPAAGIEPAAGALRPRGCGAATPALRARPPPPLPPAGAVCRRCFPARSSCTLRAPPFGSRAARGSAASRPASRPFCPLAPARSACRCARFARLARPPPPRVAPPGFPPPRGGHLSPPPSSGGSNRSRAGLRPCSARGTVSSSLVNRARFPATAAPSPRSANPPAAPRCAPRLAPPAPVAQSPNTHISQYATPAAHRPRRAPVAEQRAPHPRRAHFGAGVIAANPFCRHGAFTRPPAARVAPTGAQSPAPPGTEYRQQPARSACTPPATRA